MLNTPRAAKSILSSYRLRTVPRRSITSSIMASVGRRCRADQLPPRPLDQQPLQLRLQPAHLGGDVAAQAGVAAQLPGRDALDQALGLSHQAVQLLAGT